MKLTFKRREVTSVEHLGTLVADNLDAIEPGLQILASNLNLGRTKVELAGLDGEHVPVLFILGLAADDAMLVRALEAYAWCLEYPESVQRLGPASVQPGWPPRIVFVAERLLESFVRKMRLLRFSAVDCFEFRYVEANGAAGFYLDRVDWAPVSPGSVMVAARPEHAEPPIVEPVVALDEPRVVPREEPKLVLLREEPHAEPRVAPREEPKIVPLAPVEEPRIVMLHETKGVPRIVEPAAPHGALDSDSSERSERSPVVLKGLRPPSEPSARRRPREMPETLRGPEEEKAMAPREAVKASPAPAPAADPRPTPRAVEPRTKGDATKTDPPKNGASKNDLTHTDALRGDGAKGDLAPTWRKFLDRLTSTFDTRPQSAPETSRPSVPPPAPLAIQPFAADIEVTAREVAPDEAGVDAHDAIGDPTDKPRRILQGLTLPDNAELAPQWRKFLDHPALDETKIGVVRGYLQREFPLCTVYDFYDFQRNAQVFQLQDNHGQVSQLITMSAEFFDTHRDLEIRAWIEKHRLAQAMRQAGQAGVLVSQAGLQIEKR